MDDQLLQILTQAAFVLLFVWTAVDLVRRPDRRRLEIAALFASLAGSVVVQSLVRITGLDLTWVTTGATLLVLAQPYLLLRLVEHFEALPRIQHAVGLVLTAVSWALVLMAGRPLPSWATVGVVVAFAYVEMYATAAFIRAARRARGVTRRRLVAVALGSGLLASVILLAGVSAAAPESASIVPPLSRLMGLASAVAYFVGFAPPRWLRRAWQMAELQRFLVGVGGRTAEERLTAALDRVGPAATRVLGAKAAIVALGPPDSERLDIHLDPENEGPLRTSRVVTLALGDDAAMLGRVWRGRRAAAVKSGRWDPELRRLAGAFGGATCALVAPLLIGGQPHGLIVVLLERGSLFMDDELALLAILAEQAASAAESSQLFLEMRRQNAALEAATRLKSEFLANMSHELRTPLNAIIGFSELMIDAPEDEDPATARAYLDTIHSSGQHLLALINDVLDLSKIEAGKMELHLDELRVAEVVMHALATVEPLAQRKAIRLAAEVGDVGTLVADEGRVKQVLLNLLSNAIKFTPEGGRVTVQAQSTAGAVVLTVADTGIGIAPEDQARIFQEFQQIDGSASRRYEGTGLGLALTRRFVELHGGRIWVESEAGQGSRFRVSLPLGASASAPRPSEPTTHIKGPARRLEAEPGSIVRPLVLVIEDDPRAANLLSLYLGGGGYRVEVAPDGEAALRMARALSPLAITLDVDLPKIDGWEVLRSLKLDDCTRDVPVVVVSVIDNEELGYALGAVDYFVKPVDRQALLARLGKYRFTERAQREETTVLVVDDEPAAIELLAGMLVPAGFRVLRADGGAEGIALARQSRPDLILLDLMMPEVNGFDVVAALSSDPATRDISILVVTAKELTTDEKASLNGHVASVLSKGAFGGMELLAWLDDLALRMGAGKGVGHGAR